MRSLADSPEGIAIREPPYEIKGNIKWVNKVTHYLRFLADSNRRIRFCRPPPSHSAKEPFFIRTANLRKNVFSTMFYFQTFFQCISVAF